MPSNLSLSGAQAQKQTRFAPIFTSRFFSGLWSNRSPLRDATTSRIVERYYGAAGDALIAGLNTEITTKLTLVRRPGTSLFDTFNTYDAPDRFYEFKLFGPTTEQINVMIDESNVLYSYYNGERTTVFNKSAAGQAFMQSVGNILYFGDGSDNKKWQQTLFEWTAETPLGTGTTPFFTTYYIDFSGNIQQLIGTNVPITETILTAPTPTTGPVLTIDSSVTLSNIVAVGDVITFPSTMATSWLRYQSATILSITGMTMVVQYPLPYLVAPGTQAETVSGIVYNGGTPTTGTTEPNATGSTQFNTAVTTTGGGAPTYVGTVVGNQTVDGSAVWQNRSNPVQNWGLSNINNAPIIPLPSASSGIGDALDQIPFYEPNASYGTGAYVVDTNNNIQKATTGGSSGLAAPVFNTILGQTTTDNTVTWTLEYIGAISATNGGWRYAVALVNTLDNTVSNCSSLTIPTGNFTGAQGVYLPPGAGLPTAVSGTVSVDTQADYVAIFRTTDGQSLPFLIPSASGVLSATLPLDQYLQNGYTDTTPDVFLNNLVSGAIIGENTPPATGAINLAYHLGCIWYSIGNVVYWTSGPATPVGNGLNGTNPLNTDSMASLVKRLVPTATGMLVFTVSDVYLIQGSNTASSPIQPAVPILPGIGLLSYNALDLNGPLIGLFTTDNQFLILDPSNGTTFAGLPIGDQLLLNNGNPGQSWNPANVYVAWHVQGMDQAWYLCDGVNGWYKLIPTPSPEGPGYTWAPFAAITGGAGTVQSVEVTPGVHRLLIGPTGSGSVLERNLNVWTDNGVAYPANATVGSAVLTQPGQVATVAHIVTDCVRIGSPISLGILVDEALPYYTGPIDILNNWVFDPPGLKQSKSFWSQRFYLSELEDESATMRHCQIQILFDPSDTVQNEIQTLTIFGSYLQEI
jgi:hypothetical protein